MGIKSVQWLIGVYKSTQWYTRVYSIEGIQGFTGINKGMQGCTEVYNQSFNKTVDWSINQASKQSTNQSFINGISSLKCSSSEPFAWRITKWNYDAN